MLRLRGTDRRLHLREKMSTPKLQHHAIHDIVPVETIIIHVGMTLKGKHAETLIKHAERRGMEPAEMLSTIIETILSDDLVDAVIDDGEDGR